MTTIALPTHAALACDPDSHALLQMTRCGYLTQGYDHDLQPVVLLDGTVINRDLTEYVTALWAWGLLAWGPPDDRDVQLGRLTDLGERVLARWDAQASGER